MKKRKKQNPRQPNITQAIGNLIVFISRMVGSREAMRITGYSKTTIKRVLNG